MLTNITVQGTILAALDLSDTATVRVNGRYLGNVLALQAQGLITHRVAEDGVLEVSKVAPAPMSAMARGWYKAHSR